VTGGVALPRRVMRVLRTAGERQQYGGNAQRDASVCVLHI
jgi:hypothetical protein